MKRILCFGDSNTYGVNPEGGERFNEDERWSALLAKELNGQAIVIEEGYRGRNSIFFDPFVPDRRGIDALPMLLSTHSPLDLVILALGTNDTKTFFAATPSVIASAEETLINVIKEKSNARVLLISPTFIDERVLKTIHTAFDQSSIEKSKELSKLFEGVANKTDSFFLDLASVTSAGADGLHMNKEGHKKASLAIAEKVKFILSKI